MNQALLSHCASMYNPPKVYPLEVGLKVASYRGSRIMELIGEGFSREDAGQIAQQEILRRWGEPK